MAVYITIQDLSDAVGGDKTLIELTDDPDPSTGRRSGAINTEICVAIINAVSGTIDGYLEGVYTLPVPQSGLLTGLAKRLARHDLYMRRGKSTDAIRQDAADATNTLMLIAKGTIRLGKPDSATPAGIAFTSATQDNVKFSNPAGYRP